MIRQALQSFELIWLTCLGLILFFSVFVSLLFWVNRKGSAGLYEKLSAMPLDEQGRTSQKGVSHV